MRCFVILLFGVAFEVPLSSACDLDAFALLRPGVSPVREREIWLGRHSLTSPVQRAFDSFMSGIDARTREECRTLWKITTGLHAVGEKVQVGGKTVTIEGMLGVGGEGVVYLARGPDGPCTLKEFFNKDEMAQNLVGMQKHANRQVPIPSILGSDSARGRVLFQYIRGIPVDVLLTSSGIGAGARHIIRQKLEEVEEQTGISLPEANVILELSSGKFYLIDSR